MKNSKFIIVLSTINSPTTAHKIATILVQEKLAACVNITPKIRSIYWWKGKICEENELLMIFKTRKGLYSLLEKRLKALHPYEVPEIIGLPIEEGSQPYLDWILQSCKKL